MIGILSTKTKPLIIINGLRPIQSASSPANKVEITLPSSTAATMMDSCPAFRCEVRFAPTPQQWQADIHQMGAGSSPICNSFGFRKRVSRDCQESCVWGHADADGGCPRISRVQTDGRGFAVRLTRV